MLKLLFYITLFIRSLLYPLVRLILAALIPNLAQRIKFEDQNNNESGAQSFKLLGLRAHQGFHFSSEGEFELIKPLIESALNQGHLVELIFTSPSVEKKVVSLYNTHRDQIRYLRVPLASFFPFYFGQNILWWTTANIFMMVRYDFFPELFLLKDGLAKLILFAASARSKSNLGFRFVLKKYLYDEFDEIYPSTKRDYDFFNNHFPHKLIHKPVELRGLQIKKRQSSNLFYINNSELLELFKIKESLGTQSYILAQMWPMDLRVLRNREFLDAIVSGESLAYLAPHKLDDKFCADLISEIEKIAVELEVVGLKIYFLAKNASSEDIKNMIENYQKNPGLIFSCLPGILCELYSHFNFAYIGGGFGKGVHSLLEPFVAGCKLACGPNIHRSTEYDIITDLGQDILVFNGDNLDDYYPMMQNHTYKSVGVSEFLEQNEKQMISVSRTLGIKK